VLPAQLEQMKQVHEQQMVAQARQDSQLQLCRFSSLSYREEGRPEATRAREDRIKEEITRQREGFERLMEPKSRNCTSDRTAAYSADQEKERLSACTYEKDRAERERLERTRAEAQRAEERHVKSCANERQVREEITTNQQQSTTRQDPVIEFMRENHAIRLNLQGIARAQEAT